jgi:uncharacterized OB-fold protein
MIKKVPIRQGVFIEESGGGILLANRCKSCGQIFFPKAIFCLACFNDDLEELRLGPRGQLYSYTVAHMPSMHFYPPYAIGYIDMPEGVRIFAPLIIDENRSFRVGMEMEIVIGKLWEEGEEEVIGYMFKPLK